MEVFKPLPYVMNEFMLYEIRKHFPFSIKAYNMVVCCNEGLFTERKIFYRPHFGYLDPNACIIKNIYLGKIKDPFHSSYAIVASDEKVLETILMSSSMFDWTQPLLFNTVTQSQVYTYQTATMSKGGVTYIAAEPLCLYTLEDKSKLDIPYPTNIEVITLDKSHAKLVYDMWKLKYLMDLEHVETILDKRKCVGIVLANTKELVSWFMINAYGSMGLLYTKEEHRRKGYAAVCISAMSKNLLTEGSLIVCVDIEDKNTKSKMLFEKLGFVGKFKYFVGKYIPNNMKDRPEFSDVVAEGILL